MQPDIDALIAQLEAASGPDRELDLALACIHYNRPEEYFLNDELERRHHSDARRYTASLDAAMSLLPEGWDWRCGPTTHVPHTAEVFRKVGQGGWVGECDSNRAIALLIAILKARKAAA